MFQFLIGRLRTGSTMLAFILPDEFQFLIGRLRTKDIKKLEQELVEGFNSS